MIEQPFTLFSDHADDLKVTIYQRDESFDVSGASVDQVHGAVTVIAREPMERALQADGLVTDVSGLPLSVRWADCQNFVIFAPEKKVLGLLHVGWRGLVAGAIEEHFRTLSEEWGIAPQDTLVGAGPCLCTACAEFSNPANELTGVSSKFFSGNNVDLRGIADAKLIELGVPKDQLQRLDICTKCNADDYWSYRGGDREEVLAGKTNALAATLL